MSTLGESDVERAALNWLDGIGWVVMHGPDIAPDTLAAERADYSQVMLAKRLRGALAALSPDLPVDALDDAYLRLTRSAGSSPNGRNRAFHHMVVNGIEIEYRDAEGRLRGDQVRVIDFENPANNDWLAVNQFTVTENQPAPAGPDIVLFVNGLPLARHGAQESRWMRTPPSARPGTSSRPTRPSCPPSSP